MIVFEKRVGVMLMMLMDKSCLSCAILNSYFLLFGFSIQVFTNNKTNKLTTHSQTTICFSLFVSFPPVCFFVVCFFFSFLSNFYSIYFFCVVYLYLCFYYYPFFFLSFSLRIEYIPHLTTQRLLQRLKSK